MSPEEPCRGRRDPRAASDPWTSVSAATKAALLEEFGRRWTPFAFHVTWRPPQDDNERSKVFRAHWRRVYKCAVLCCAVLCVLLFAPPATRSCVCAGHAALEA